VTTSSLDDAGAPVTKVDFEAPERASASGGPAIGAMTTAEPARQNTVAAPISRRAVNENMIKPPEGYFVQAVPLAADKILTLDLAQG
jgi:hypothetical protein